MSDKGTAVLCVVLGSGFSALAETMAQFTVYDGSGFSTLVPMGVSLVGVYVLSRETDDDRDDVRGLDGIETADDLKGGGPDA